MSAFHCGTVGIAGRPNTGKSSLLNRLVGQKLSSVSARAQTTRHLITGIITTDEAQLIFVDSPGLPENTKNALHRVLGRRSNEAVRDSDVVMLVMEVGRVLAGDRALLARIPEDRTVVAVINKVDRIAHSGDLLPHLEKVSKLRTFHAIVPVSARTGRNLPELLRVLREALPEAPAQYPADQLTDRDERFFAAEALREKLFRTLGAELPYRCEVVIDSFKEDGALRRIEASILVERDSQKGIVVGRDGAILKKIGTEARRDLEKLFGGKVYLGLWVKVRKGWSDDEQILRRLGYG